MAISAAAFQECLLKAWNSAGALSNPQKQTDEQTTTFLLVYKSIHPIVSFLLKQGIKEGSNED